MVNIACLWAPAPMAQRIGIPGETRDGSPYSSPLLTPRSHFKAAITATDSSGRTTMEDRPAVGDSADDAAAGGVWNMELDGVCICRLGPGGRT
jgi:hypothetical protein